MQVNTIKRVQPALNIKSDLSISTGKWKILEHTTKRILFIGSCTHITTILFFPKKAKICPPEL